MYLNQYKQNKNDSINNNGDNSKNNKNDNGNTVLLLLLLLLIIVIITNSLFQSGDFSAGSTTEHVYFGTACPNLLNTVNLLLNLLLKDLGNIVCSCILCR